MLPPKDGTAPSGPSFESEQALSDWMVFLYSELRRLACYYLEQERPNHTLQATALVHEAYLRLVEQRGVRWQSRTQVIAIAAQMMRRILLDYSRSHESAKRGGNVNRVFLEEASLVSKEQAADVIVLDEASAGWSNGRLSMRAWSNCASSAGLSIEETAEVLEVSPATVKRHWNVAKAWLARDLRGK